MTANCSHRLDLTFFATGSWQHVFVTSGREAEPWVYKIPSAFGYVLPFNDARRYRPENLCAAVLDVALTHLPPGERLLAAYWKRASLKKFTSMLGLIEDMSRDGLADLIPPYEVIRDGEATLRVNGRIAAYRGHILKQRRADFLFEGSENLPPFEWREVVEAHHRLWRRGVTFSTTTAILGLKNWGLLEGRLRLFDTSSLIRDARKVRRHLGREELYKREEAMKRRTGGNRSKHELEYFRFIRREINQSKLDQLWRADLSTEC